MSEYNIQMNKYNALNTEYDQLYPQPMKHASTHAKDGSDPITPTSIGAYSKSETNSLLSSKPNPNLLDNWYFGNPVDQRQGRVVVPNTTYYSDKTLTTSAGTTSAYVTAYRYATGTASGVSYASFKLTDTDDAPAYYAAPENVVRGYTGEGYGPDRWKRTAAAARIIINDDTVTFKSDDAWITIGQLLERGVSVNMQHTVSALVTAYPSLWRFSIRTYYTDGTLAERVQDLTGVGLNSYTFNPANNTNKTVKTIGCFLQARQNNASITLKAMKLELGDQQTLAHQDADGNWQLNALPNYADTLARCQRYYFKPPVAFAGPSCMVATSSNEIRGSVVFPVQMRSVPSISNVILRRNSNGEILKPTGYAIGMGGGNDGFNTIWAMTGVSLITGENYTVDYEAIADL